MSLCPSSINHLEPWNPAAKTVNRRCHIQLYLELAIHSQSPQRRRPAHSYDVPNYTNRMHTIMPEPRLPAPQGRAGLSDQHEGCVVSQGHCDGDVYGAADQQARDCDRSGTGGERGREQPRATREHRDGDRVGHRHARQVARAHEGREHVAGAPELDAQDGRLGGQKRSARPPPRTGRPTAG